MPIRDEFRGAASELAGPLRCSGVLRNRGNGSRARQPLARGMATSRPVWPSWRSLRCVRFRRSEQAASLSLAPMAPGSLRARNRVLVDVRVSIGGRGRGRRPRRGRCRRSFTSAADTRSVTGAVRPSDLEALPVSPGRRRHRGPLADRRSRWTCCRGHLLRRRCDLEGDCSAWRPQTCVRSSTSTGPGLTVGILSDSFDRDTGAAKRSRG